VCLLLFPAVQAFITRTRPGKAIQALSSNPSLAEVVGIDQQRTYALIFAVGSALAGVAAALLSIDLGVTADFGFTLILFAVVSVIIGGLGHLPGAAFGGVLLGLLQALSTAVLPLAWQDVIVYGLLFLFLLFRPQGIFGHRQLTRAV
jgi:branched-chain amino acid transport system permease protein